MNLVKEPLLKLDPGVLCKWERWNVYLDEYAQLRVEYTARVLEKPLPEELREIAISQDDLQKPFLCVAGTPAPEQLMDDTVQVQESDVQMFAWRTFRAWAPANMLEIFINDLRSGAIYTRKYSDRVRVEMV